MAETGGPEPWPTGAEHLPGVTEQESGAREFSWQLVALARRWSARLNERLAQKGMTRARWQVLFWTAATRDDITQQHLADRIGVASSTMVRTLDALERQGLIVRQDCPTDKRAKLVRLTPAAQDVLSDITHTANQLRREVLAGVHPAELGICRLVIEKMQANLVHRGHDQAALNQPPSPGDLA
jgi:MarR family transcriptional regulator, transcriptional regulator for hemolysin